GLEAAMSVCLAEPETKPVHRLRTETRRVEALLLLLALMPDLPEHRKEAGALLRVLGKVRRAAGEVRDLDVHRKMLETVAEAEPARAPSEAAEPEASAGGQREGAPSARKLRARQPAGAEQGAVDHDGSGPASVSKSALKLRKQMGRDRDKAASALKHLLKDRQVKIARAAEALLKALEPAQENTVAASELLRDAEAVLGRAGFLGYSSKQLRALDEDELHAVRKAAKAARYVAESLPEDQALSQAARSFEALQEAGGQWHDALELARAARRYFGKGHELTEAYRKERDLKLKAYREALLARTKTAKPVSRRNPASVKRSAVKRRSVA
ncbi:MAG TPA: CHAD domain-containing protein, partial [Acidobacteriaceae bacterium]|nr:CHAD domain-containing protein [Acidobacteriaceae bacterium]